MLESHLTIANLPWAPASGEQAATSEITADTAALLAGRFATAYREGDRVVLARDRLGLNKLFVAHHPVRGVVAANYLRDLIRTGIAFRDIHAVPAGAVVTVDPRRRTASTHHYYILPATSGGTGRPQREILAEIDATLRRGMERLAADHTGAPVAICLSGGADSALIALHAKRCFPRATAYTYTYTSDGAGLSQDAAAAQHVAQHLGLDHRLVPADTEAILAALQPALLHGQDWRDFNVHAAVVNTLLAAAIAAEHQTVRGPAPLVLTGDLMNEVLGDYSPLHYAGTTYYPLPAVGPSRLRTSLTRGIQAGDREVGVFNAHGLRVVQPYAWAFQALLELPDPVAKHEIMTALADGGLPDDILVRPKVRAQIGEAHVHRGILPLLLDAGHDSDRLQQDFCQVLAISDPRELRAFLRGGVYRPLPATHR